MLSPGLLTHWTQAALDAARAGDEPTTAEVAGRICEVADVLDLVATCRLVAGTAVRALLVLYEPPDPAAGEAWALVELGDAEGHPERLFAARLITAHANQDSATVTALVAAAAGASHAQRTESLRALLSYAARLDAEAARRTPHLSEGETDE
ncbi:hypothetical protein ACFWH1_18765 [Streptomyces sp. NPDC127037]|uniref:hypothetical protein n=1 Tax=Streptomyces sp. NPDC127037 TaxID=3347113 RepID=UPI00365FEE63